MQNMFLKRPCPFQDCNGDGIVNCFDYAAIHRLGGYGCGGPLDYNYQSKYLNCQQQVEAHLQGGNLRNANAELL